MKTPINTQTTATKQGTRLSDVVAVGFIGLSIVAGALAIFFVLRYGKQLPPPQTVVGPYPAVLNFQNFNVGAFGTNGITRTYLEQFNIKDVRDGAFQNPWEIVQDGGNKALRLRWQYSNGDASWYFDPDRQYPVSHYKLSLDFRLSPTWQGDKMGGGKHMFYPSTVLGLVGPNLRFDFSDLDGWDQANQRWTHQNTMKKITVYSRANNTHQERNWNFGTALPNNPNCTQGYNACFIPGDWYALELTVDCNLDNGNPGTAQLDIKKGGNAYRTFSTTLNDYEKEACRQSGGADMFRFGNYDIYNLCNNTEQNPCQTYASCNPVPSGQCRGGANNGQACTADGDCPDGTCRASCNLNDPRLTPENTWFELDNITMQYLGEGTPPPICANGQQITETCLCGGEQHSNGYCCNGVWQQGSCAPTNQRPTATITNPDNGDTVSGTVVVTATADDPDGTVGSVKFFLDDEEQFEDPTAPYEWTWATNGNSQHTLKAIAFDNDGDSSPEVQGQNVISVTTSNPTYLFQENFNDGNADGWTSTGASWTVSNAGENANSYYRSNFSGAGIVYATNQLFSATPFQVTTRVKKVVDGGSAALLGYYRTQSSTDNYLLLADFSNDKLTLLGAGGQTIQEANATLAANQWYILKLTFSAVTGVTGTIRIDGGQTDLASVSISSLYPFPAGTIALQCNNSGNANNHCRFDDIAVSLISESSPPPPQGGTTFSDDFNDGNATGWSTSTGTWAVQNGEYRSTHTDNSDRFAWADNQTFSTLPFDLKVKTKLEGGVGPIGITAYRTSDTNQYRFVYVKTQAKLYLYKGTTTLASLSNVNLPITNPHWMKLSVSQQGSGIKLDGRIWADGANIPDTPTITATDAVPLTAGTIGLYCRDTSTICRFDDVTVTGQGGTTPGGGGGSPVFLKIEPSAPIE